MTNSVYQDLSEQDMIKITDDMCRRAAEAYVPDRIQGFSTPLNSSRTEWGAPHYIRDVWLKPEEQLLWKGDSYDEMEERHKIERMRLALKAALETK